MSDEGMVTMDEDEEIGQVRFVEYTCVLCFSLPFDRRDGGEMMIITSHRLPSSRRHRWWFLPRVVVVRIAKSLETLLLAMCARRERE